MKTCGLLVTGFSLQMIAREECIFVKVIPINVQWILGSTSLNIELGASLWSCNRVLVVSLVAVSRHERAVEGVHPGALVVPHPEPDNELDLGLSKISA